MHHVLFVCPTWSALRARILSDCRTTDLRKLLNDYKGAKAAIKFMLQTDLLVQFRLIASSEQANRTGLPDLAVRGTGSVLQLSGAYLTRQTS